MCECADELVISLLEEGYNVGFVTNDIRDIVDASEELTEDTN